MRRRLSREVLIFAAVAVVSAVAGAAGMYGFLELEHRVGPAALSGSYSDPETGQQQVSGAPGTVFLPYLNATVMLDTPSSFDPQSVDVTVHVPGDSLVLPDGSSVSRWTLHYDPNSYPHWLVEGYDSSGHHFYWPGLTATFVNQDGGVVRTFNSSLRSASSIESGALMTVAFPSYFSSLAGVSVILTYNGYAGELQLTVA